MKKFEINDELSNDELVDGHFSASIVHKIEPAALKFTGEHIINNISLYRFLKMIVSIHDIRRNPEVYNKIIHRLKIVIDSAGLIS